MWLPISGRVADAVTGAPIANAVVTYSGRGDVLSRIGGEPTNPPSMNGEVRTREDGTFTLPQLVPGGFEVRVSAPGYMSARQYLSEIPAGYKPVAVPLPEAFCKARYGKPNCVAPPLPDGNFALQPTSIDLKQMGSAAQADFGLPTGGPLLQMPYFPAAALSANGQWLALVSIIPQPDSPQQAPCAGWIYDLNNDHLQRIEPDLPQGFCQGLPPRLRWEGQDVILKIADLPPADDRAETMRWRDGSAKITSVEKLSPVSSVTPNGFQTDDDTVVLDTTDDGEFSILDVSPACRQCIKRIVTSRQGDWKMSIEDPIAGYLLDDTNDRLVSLPANNPSQDVQSIGIQIMDLKSHQQKIIVVPAQNRPHLVATQLLNDGRTRFAYTVVGACDPFNATAPHDPPPGASSTSFTKQTLCIVTAAAQQNLH